MAEEQAPTLVRRAQRDRADQERCSRILREYQRRTAKTQELQCEIMKGVKAGENIYTLFLKVVKACSLMSNNSVFYDQIERDIVAVYGEALKEPEPLQMEIQQAQDRLSRLQQAEQEAESIDSRDRIRSAINAHKAHIERLQSIMDQ